MYFNLEMSLNYSSLEQLPPNLLKINVLLELKVWVIIFRVGGIYFLGSVPENLSLKKIMWFPFGSTCLFPVKFSFPTFDLLEFEHLAGFAHILPRTACKASCST